MLEWHFVENGLNPPPLRHFVRSPTVLVPSALCEMSVWIGCRLARIEISLVKDWHLIDILVWDWQSGSRDWHSSGTSLRWIR